MPSDRQSLTTDDVRRLVREECFPSSPSGRIGVEVEWLAVRFSDPSSTVLPELVGADRQP